MFQLTLRRRGISDQAVLRAMEEVPREAFVTEADRADAYRDSALGIACGQTISQPFVVAYMTEQLQLQKRHRVLEIGTGSGYQAAILSRLADHVLTIERFRTLADGARERLARWQTTPSKRWWSTPWSRLRPTPPIGPPGRWPQNTVCPRRRWRRSGGRSGSSRGGPTASRCRPIPTWWKNWPAAS